MTETSGDTFKLKALAWINTKRALEHFVKVTLDESPVVVFDLETTGLDEYAVTGGKSNGGVAARVVLASFTIPDGTPTPRTWVLPLSHPDSPWRGQWRKVYRYVVQALRGKMIVGHNVKYDLRWTRAVTGISLAHDLHWDTMLSSHLLDENNTTKLKEVAPRTFGVERWDDVDLKYPGAAEEEPLLKLGEYAARDTYWTWRLYENHYDRMVPDQIAVFEDEVEEARLGKLARWIVMPTAAELCTMEERGIPLDTRWITIEFDRLEEEREEATSELVERYDLSETPAAGTKPSFAPTSKWFQAWTEKAVEAGDLRIAALTPNGKPQWSKAVLNKQARAGAEVPATLLKLRNAVKRQEFLTAWMEKMTPDGRIHATFNAGSVVTGRLSSSGPNLQQVTKGLKPAFMPSEGYYLAEIDYSQIELRVAAFISRCEPMMQAFRNGDDLHRLIAARVNGKSPSEITKEERQQGKAANFGLLYGMGVRGFQEYAETAYGVEMSEEEAARIHAAYFEMWTGLREWHMKAMAQAHRAGQVVSPVGRVRHLEQYIWDGNEERVSFGERAAVNSPVQGFASDIMQTAGALIEGLHPTVFPGVPEARLVGTVHDSIMVEVPIEDWERVTRACKRVMEDEVPLLLEHLGVQFDVPLVADATVGTRWGLEDVGTIE